MEEGEDLSADGLGLLEQVDIDLESRAGEVNEGFCKECGGRLVKMVENRDFLDGSISFHIIKLKCDGCGKEYLDLNQADKYDFLLILEKAIKSKIALKVLARKIST